MNSQLFLQMSSLGYSNFSKNIKEKFTATDLTRYEGDLDKYIELREKMKKDQKYDFDSKILNFNDKDLLITEQIKRDNEMLVTREDYLKTATYITAATMTVFAVIIVVTRE